MFWTLPMLWATGVCGEEEGGGGGGLLEEELKSGNPDMI